MLAGMEPRFKTHSQAETLLSFIHQGSPVIWLPDHHQLSGIKELPPTWDLTSDSLAAWLAGRIGARRLLLIKSAPTEEPLPPLSDLFKTGLVDPCFQRFTGQTGLEVWIAGAEQHDRLQQGLKSPESSFIRVGGPKAG